MLLFRSTDHVVNQIGPFALHTEQVSFSRFANEAVPSTPLRM